jgi:hypothetical protein
MYIYHVSWAQEGCMGLNAVVTASTEESAIKQLGLSEEDKCQKATMIGIALKEYTGENIFAQESL